MKKRIISRKYLIKKSREKVRMGFWLGLALFVLLVAMILAGDSPDGETIIALIICAIGGIVGFYREIKRRIALRNCRIFITKEVIVGGESYTNHGNTHRLTCASGRQVTINEVFYASYEGTVVYLVQFPTVIKPWIFDCRHCELDDELSEMCIDRTDGHGYIMPEIQNGYMDEGAIL